MPVINLDYIKDLIKACSEGNLLITYYRDYDLETERIKMLFKYIDKNKSRDCNWVKINVTDFPEVCAELHIYPPCTVLYQGSNKIEYNFGSYMTGCNIIATVRYFSGIGNTGVTELEDGDFDFYL